MKLTLMKQIKQILMVGSFIFLASLTAFAQKDKDQKKETPDKKNPPVVVVPDRRNPPKETPPKENPKPKKPEIYFE